MKETKTDDSWVKQQEIIKVIDDVFDDWSEDDEVDNNVDKNKNRSNSNDSKNSNSNSDSSSDSDDLPIISHANNFNFNETNDLVDTDSDVEADVKISNHPNTHTPLSRKLNNSQINKKGWKKIDIWMPTTESQSSKKSKKMNKNKNNSNNIKSSSIIPSILPEKTPAECIKHIIEQINEDNIHSVAEALLLYPQQISTDNICQYISQIAKQSSPPFINSQSITLSLLKSLMYFTSSDQGLLLYKSIFLSLQHQLISLLKTGDGPQYLLIRKSLLGYSTENYQSVPTTSAEQSELEINALLDEGLQGFDVSESNDDESDDSDNDDNNNHAEINEEINEEVSSSLETNLKTNEDEIRNENIQIETLDEINMTNIPVNTSLQQQTLSNNSIFAQYLVTLILSAAKDLVIYLFFLLLFQIFKTYLF